MNSEFKNNGYVLLKNLFSKDEMYDLKKEIHLVFENQFKQRNFSYEKNDLLDDADLYRFFSKFKDDYIKCMMLVQNSIILYRYSTAEKLLKKRYG